jgi:hypothetical protein
MILERLGKMKRGSKGVFGDADGGEVEIIDDNLLGRSSEKHERETLGWLMDGTAAGETSLF